ncbi:unnamed protein product [Linum trigynum]|uniref:RNase H type-1 domain-containing protein n=1 Tax=Linum trigynum TaxID=586398 RepID=A0AAV2DJN4_9ROSI
MVADLWDPDNGWKLNEFQDSLPQHMIDNIRSVLVDPMAGEDDQSIWNLSSNGLFTASSAFKAISPQHQSSLPPSFWQRIWKLHVPERVRVFMWMASKGRLTTNSIRKYRHITQDDKCPECPDVSESNLHYLRDCVLAKAVWLKIIPAQEHSHFFSLGYENWLQENISNEDHGDWTGDWASYFSLITWYLWKYRNDSVFKGKKLSPSSLHNYVMAKAREWSKAWSEGRLDANAHDQHARTEALISWKAPAAGWGKMNTDGAAQGSPRIASAGGALRDSQGTWLGGFCSKMGNGTAIMAELWGILQGLQLAWKKGIRFLILESDSQLALDLIKNRTDAAHLHATILGLIRRLLAQGWVVQLAHTYREGNRVADWLSKHSLVYPFGTYELDEPPGDLKKIMQEDLLGVSFPRQVLQRSSSDN